MINITKYKTYLFDYLVNYHNINNPKKFFHCLNPKHVDNNPSMMFTDKYQICKCFSCGVSYDIFDLIGIDFNINNFKDKIKKVEELYNEYVPIYTEHKDIKTLPERDYTNYYKVCLNNITNTNYLESRGINPQLIKKYNIGYDDRRNLVVIPISKSCYFARSTVNNNKFKSKGASDVWNKQLLNNQSDDIYYVTEGIIDSLSLETIDENIKTISINGVGNINSFYHLIKDKNFKGTIVIAFDNDNAGVDAGKKLEKKLNDLNGVTAFFNPLIKNFGDVCKDINQALLLDKDKLKRNLEYFNDAYLTISKRQKEGNEIIER